LPSGRGFGIVDALGNRANDHVAELDAPALLPDVGIAAVGEGGHAPSSQQVGGEGRQGLGPERRIGLLEHLNLPLGL
jgi:hypothetical protein